MSILYEHLLEAQQFIQSRTAVRPAVAVVLGSGLGEFARQLQGAERIPYAEIPHFPRPTVEGHAGELLLGAVEEVPTVVLAGRAHLYEGYTAQQVTLSLRVCYLLGARSAILTNAAGGIRADLKAGTLLLIRDHINLQGSNPLMGPNENRLGPRFPDMSEAYDSRYRLLAREAAAELGQELAEGVYAALSGPSYETPAEVRFLQAIGADVVGMSTVPEAIVAKHMGMRVLGISCVVNPAAGALPQKIDHAEVLAAGERMKEPLVALLQKVIPRIYKDGARQPR